MESHTLLVFITLFLILQRAVAYIGQNRINQTAWNIYQRVSVDPGVKQLQGVAKELRQTYRERSAISAQDEYAKWTKLNRKFDKLTKEKTTLESSLGVKKTAFNSKVLVVTQVITTAPLYAFRIFVAKSVLFQMPDKVLPRPVEWIMAFPLLPTGAVGAIVWIYALSRVLSLATMAVQELALTPKVQKPVKPAK